jgi:hypothetical protein
VSPLERVLVQTLRDLRDACESTYKRGCMDPEPFVRAGNVIADAVSGAGLTEAGGPPLTLVSPGTPSEPSASPAAETVPPTDVPATPNASTPARPHGGPEDQAGAAAPACRCGHDAWDHTWRCNAQLAPDEWCDCIEWREA